MIRRIQLMLALVVSTFTIVSAQSTISPGYIITIKGDTLKGQIKFNPKNDLLLYDAITFQTNASDKKSYRANKIKEYSFDGNVFVSRMIDGKPVFVKRLSAGAVNLYEYKVEEFFMNNIHVRVNYYMEKLGDTEFMHIRESKFKKQLAEALSDDQDLIKDIQEKKYDYENIVDIFEQYNKNKEDKKG